MTAALDPRAALLSALAWQIELGADEAIADAPVDRFAEAADAAASSRPTPGEGPAPAGATRHGESAAAGIGRGAVPAHPAPMPGAVRTPSHSREGRGGGDALPGPADARALAEAAQTLDELAAAIRDWPGSPLRDSARNLVFADGLPGARLMVIGEAPGADEDRAGKPFVGRAGRLLDRMLNAIGLSRSAPAPEAAVYIVNILPWRPPGNRTPSEAEALQFLPFVERHIALARPELILAVGSTPTKALLATSSGIRRMRGRWVRHRASDLPLMPSFHPAYLLRTPEDKRLAWRDLLAVRRALDGETPT